MQDPSPGVPTPSAARSLANGRTMPARTWNASTGGGFAMPYVDGPRRVACSTRRPPMTRLCSNVEPVALDACSASSTPCSRASGCRDRPTDRSTRSRRSARVAAVAECMDRRGVADAVAGAEIDRARLHARGLEPVVETDRRLRGEVVHDADESAGVLVHRHTRERAPSANARERRRRPRAADPRLRQCERAPDTSAAGTGSALKIGSAGITCWKIPRR